MSPLGFDSAALGAVVWAVPPFGAACFEVPPHALTVISPVRTATVHRVNRNRVIAAPSSSFLASGDRTINQL